MRVANVNLSWQNPYFLIFLTLRGTAAHKVCHSLMDLAQRHQSRDGSWLDRILSPGGADYELVSVKLKTTWKNETSDVLLHSLSVSDWLRGTNGGSIACANVLDKQCEKLVVANSYSENDLWKIDDVCKCENGKPEKCVVDKDIDEVCARCDDSIGADHRLALSLGTAGNVCQPQCTYSTGRNGTTFSGPQEVCFAIRSEVKSRSTYSNPNVTVAWTPDRTVQLTLPDQVVTEQQFTFRQCVTFVETACKTLASVFTESSDEACKVTPSCLWTKTCQKKDSCFRSCITCRIFEIWGGGASRQCSNNCGKPKHPGVGKQKYE